MMTSELIIFHRVRSLNLRSKVHLIALLLATFALLTLLLFALADTRQGRIQFSFIDLRLCRNPWTGQYDGLFRSFQLNFNIVLLMPALLLASQFHKEYIRVRLIAGFVTNL